MQLNVEYSGGSYPIIIDRDVLSRYRDFIPENIRSGRKFFIADNNTESYARQICASHPLYVVKAGEASKSLATYEALLSWLLDHKVSRSDVIIAVGGGVIGDLAGFVAASTLRGLPIIQIPTTLLAMVDSSVGGKTGINMPQGKNLVGAFHQPTSVIIDMNVLQTLPDRELKAGYAEVLKYALLGDAGFFDWLEENGNDVLSLKPKALSYAIQRSCEMKAQIVKADEKETSGARALLNFGHTFAHAFEAVMGYDGRLLHGEAVAVGMICAMELSASAGHLNTQKIERAVQHIKALGLKRTIQDVGIPQTITNQDLLAIMRGDKKAHAGKIKFVLMSDIGRAFLSDEVTDEMVLEILEDLR